MATQPQATLVAGKDARFVDTTTYKAWHLNKNMNEKKKKDEEKIQIVVFLAIQRNPKISSGQITKQHK